MKHSAPVLKSVFFGCRDFAQPLHKIRNLSQTYVSSRKLAACLASNRPEDRIIVKNIERNLGTCNTAIFHLPENLPENLTAKRTHSAIATLQFVYDRIGPHIVCLTEGALPPALEDFIAAHKLPWVLGKINAAKFCGRNGIFSALRQVKFTIAEPPAFNNPVPIGELDRKKNTLKIENSTINLSPQKAQLLFALAGGDICGNTYLENEIRSKPSHAKRDILLSVQISTTLTQLRDAGYSINIQDYYGIGRRLVGLKLKIVDNTTEPQKPAPAYIEREMRLVTA